MDMTGEERIAASRATVWAALNDVEVLRQCIPGRETLEKQSDTEMTAKVKLQVGPVSARFSGKVNLSEIDPPNGYRIAGEGSGGTAGHAKGSALVRLVEDGDGTILRYEARADVGGKLAQLGGRLIDATAKKLAGEFFSKFGELVGRRLQRPLRPRLPPQPPASRSPACCAAGSPGRRATRTAATLPPEQSLAVGPTPPPTNGQMCPEADGWEAGKRAEASKTPGFANHVSLPGRDRHLGLRHVQVGHPVPSLDRQDAARICGIATRRAPMARLACLGTLTVLLLAAPALGQAPPDAKAPSSDDYSSSSTQPTSATRCSARVQVAAGDNYRLPEVVLVLQWCERNE